MNELLIKKMSSDMNITPFSDEEPDCFIARVLYSALSEQLRYGCLNELNPMPEKDGVTKAYLLQIGRKTIDAYYSVFPSFKQWFTQEDVDEAIRGIRESLIKMGDIFNNEENNRLLLSSPHKTVLIPDSVITIQGKYYDYEQYSGLGRLCTSTVPKVSDSKARMFMFPVEKWEDVDAYYSKWLKLNNTNGYEFFDVHCKSNKLSDCWADRISLKKNEITLLRESSPGGKNSIYLLKKDYGQYMYEPLNVYNSSNFEYRRIMFELRNAAGNPVKAQIEEKGNYFILRLYSRLPEREACILDYFSWPLNNVSDHNNRVFGLPLKQYIITLLDHIGIVVEENE